MSEIDPVVLQLRADVDRYIGDLRTTTTKVDDLLGRQEKQVRMLEDQFRQSSDAIKGSIGSIAGALSAGFSVDKITELADAFTRFQNSLKVTGLAGEDLERVQDRLFAIAIKNGTAIEGVGTLYSRAAQNANVLGASSTDLIHLNEAVAATLKISGATSQGASGAMLGLGQALGSSRVQTEDFNQMLEGGLLPLLQQAAKHIDGTGGTLAGLKNRLGDMKTAGVSNVQLFNAIIASLVDLQKQSSLASGTISQAFTNLETQLTRYVGEMDKAEGASAILTGALGALANNLDLIIPALATISVYMGVRYAGSLALATVATLTKIAADVRATQTAAALAVAQAEVAGMMNAEAIAAARAAAAVTELSVAQGIAQRAGVGLLGLLGGPVTAATVGLAAGMIYLNAQLEQNTAANAPYAASADKAKQSSDEMAAAIDKLTSAHGKARDAAMEQVKSLEAVRKQNLATAKSDLDAAKAALIKAKAYQAAQNTASVGSTGVPGSGMYIQGTGDVQVAQAKANIATQQATIQNYEKQIADAEKAINAPEFKAAAAAVKAKKAKKPHGPTAEQIQAKHDEEMARLQQEELQAQLEVTTDADDKASLSGEILRQEYAERATKIKADKYFTDAQKKAQLAELDKLYGVTGHSADGSITVDGKGGLLGASIYRDKIQAEEKRIADIATAQYNAQKDALQAQSDLADSTAERRKIALQMVDLDYQYQRAQQEAIANSKMASQVDKDAANAKIGVLDSQYSVKRTAAERSTENPLQSYARGLNKSDGAIQDQVEGYVTDELTSVRDSIRGAITKQLGITNDPLINGLLNMLLEQVLLKPIANALSNASSSAGGLGGLLGGLGKIFGISGARAAGGPVTGGQTYLVGENGPELFTPASSGGITPNHQLNTAAVASMNGVRASVATGGTYVTQVLKLDLSGAVMTEDMLSQMNDMAQQAAVQGAQGGRMLAARDLKAMSRPRM